MSVLDQISPIELGERLKRARSEARMTQEAAASQLGVARTTMVAIEQGERKIRPEELIKLAQVYGVTVHRLLQSNATQVDLLPLFRRNLRRDENQEAGDQVAQILQDLASAYVEIERQLGKPIKTSYPSEYSMDRGRLIDQAEEISIELRTKLGLGLGPIGDIVGVLDFDLGIRVFIYPLPSEVSGAFAYHPETQACIIINSLHPRVRQRWSLCHEFCHFMTEREITEVTWVSEYAQSNTRERFADLFAGSFLMPSVTVRRRFREVKDREGGFPARYLILLADSFGVSVEAMARRLETLALLPKGTYESISRRGLSEVKKQVLGEEAGEGSSLPLTRFTMIVIEALEKSLLTEQQAADLLALSRSNLRKLADSLLAAGDSSLGELHG